tara:strand:+ start:206 stop:400 length:195 start_codon:yes stop_codon:yes gene_type:complete
MNKPFTQEEWRNIFRSYKDEPEQQTAIEILRQHLSEDIRVDANLLTRDATWFLHYRKTHSPYLI